MAFLDLFDKLDDIIYKPVEAICSWTTEPLKRAEDKRKKGDVQQQADIDAAKREQEAELEIRKNKQMAILAADEKRWNADIDNLIGMQEIERNEKILNAIIDYRRSMIEDAKSIADNLSHMEMSLVSEAHELVLRETKKYKELQDQAMKHCDDQLEEIGKRFANNERVRIKREDMVINQTENIVQAAKDFITQLKGDIESINKNNIERIDAATQAADGILGRMSQTLAIESPSSFAIDVKKDN